jgi:hypothetical protein
MIRKAAILLLVVLVIIVLSLLAYTFFYKNINEDRLVRRHIESIRAFWLAEAGLAHALAEFSNASGNIGGSNYTYSAAIDSVNGTTNYYRISSSGRVNLGANAFIRRTLEAFVRTGSNDPANFKYAIETTTELEIRGSVDINPDDSKKEYSTLDFANLFGISKADMETFANHTYNNAVSFDMTSASQVTWINVASGVELDITGGSGSGVLIINGKVKIRGNAVFDGIIYVIGELTMTGTPVVSGAVLAESSTTVDTDLGGNVTLNYDTNKITDALAQVNFLNRNMVSWRECQPDCPEICAPDCQASCLCQ